MANFIILSVVYRANAFNDFFCSVFVDEDPNTVPSFIFTTDDRDPNPLSAIKITPATVLDKLQSLKSDKSPGPDGWPPAILKNCAKQLCVPLVILYNKSLKSGLLLKD